MMELPESVTIAQQWNALTGEKQVAAVEVGTTPHKFFFTIEGGAQYARQLAGKTLGKARPLGIYLEIEAQNNALLVGEGLALRCLAPGEAPPQKRQLLISFGDGSALSGSVSMYGGAWVHPAGTFQNPYYRAAVEKTPPLDDAFDEAYFENLLADVKPAMSAKAFLATEQRIPGLGNGVLQDILLKAGVHPKSKMPALPSGKVEALYHSVKGTLRDMTDAGGRDTEKDLLGQPGGYKALLSAKTWKQPCLLCGGPVEKQNFLGGSIYFCPACQPLAGGKA